MDSNWLRGNPKGFQLVKRKSKMIPLTVGMKNEQREKVKVHKLSKEWDARGSQ